jgi:hypothetical protein
MIVEKKVLNKRTRGSTKVWNKGERWERKRRNICESEGDRGRENKRENMHLHMDLSKKKDGRREGGMERRKGAFRRDENESRHKTYPYNQRRNCENLLPILVFTNRFVPFFSFFSTLSLSPLTHTPASRTRL